MESGEKGQGIGDFFFSLVDWTYALAILQQFPFSFLNCFLLAQLDEN